MQTEGYVLPETEEEARDLYEQLGPMAQEITREVAIAMEFDRDEYDERVTSDVVETARDALFGSLLVVTTGALDAFDSLCEQAPYVEYDLHLEGNEHVDHVAWHASPFQETIVAATYQDERAAAVATLRRIAWGRLYRPLFRPNHEDS